MDSGYGSHSGLCRDSWFRVNADSCRRVVCTRNAAPFAPPIDFNASAGNAPWMPPDTGFRIDHTTITLALERRSTLSFIFYKSWDLPYAQATVTGRHFNSCNIHVKTVLKLTGFRKWLVELKKNIILVQGDGINLVAEIVSVWSVGIMMEKTCVKNVRIDTL